MTQTNKDFEAKVKQSLDASAANIDRETQQRLDQIRRNALNQSAPSFLDKLTANWMPATGLVFCSVLALLVILPNQHMNNGADYQGQTAVLDLLENADDLDTLSDPGFYLWVDEAEQDYTGQNHAV